MKLLVHEIDTAGVSQTVRPARNIFLHTVRPHLVKIGSPTGTLKVQVCESDGTLIAESSALNISDISASQYFHGYIRFDVSAALQSGSLYLIKIVPGGGYSFAEGSYCGVCTDYDTRKYSLEYTPTGPFEDPIDMEFWERTRN